MKFILLSLAGACCAANSAYAQLAGTLGPKINLSTDGTVVATVNGSAFSWASQAGASLTQDPNFKMLSIDQPAHPAGSSQAAVTALLASGAACYTTFYQNPDTGSLYSSGMFLENKATGAITLLQDVYANQGGSNLLVATETNFQANSYNVLNGYSNNAAFLVNEQFFLRICSDGTNVTFGASPTGAGNTFQNLYTTTLAALGSPDHIGFFEDAFPTEGETFDGIMHVNKFNATQNYTPSAPIPGGDMTNGFITVPNFPASDAAPKPAAGTVPSLPGGLSLSSGATYKAYYNFTPSGNVTSRGKLNSDVYYQSIYGNENTILGSDGIEGDTASNWSEPRLYPTGSSYNLLNFTSAGLNLGVACSLNNTSAGCTQGNIYGTLVRFPTAIQLGDIVHIQMQTGNDPLWYQAFVLYAGVEQTPGPGGYPYVSPAGVQTDPNCYGENDILDGYRASAQWAIGTTLKMGVIPIKGYADNTNGECFKTAPYVKYAANGPNFSYVKAGSADYITKPLWQLQKTNTYSSLHDYVIELKNDGSNIINYYFDGSLVSSEYYEQSPTNPGWSLHLTSQTVANFNPELGSALSEQANGGIPPNSPIAGGSFSATYSVIEVIHGSVSAISQPLDTNGASPSGDPIGLN